MGCNLGFGLEFIFCVKICPFKGVWPGRGQAMGVIRKKNYQPVQLDFVLFSHTSIQGETNETVNPNNCTAGSACHSGVVPGWLPAVVSMAALRRSFPSPKSLEASA